MEAVEQAKLAEDGGGRRPDGRLAAASLRLLPDERLAHLAADGNRAAFAAIYERHHQALYRYCRTITRNDEDARDALQTTMLNAMRSINTKPTKLRAWLYRIAHNESISVLRSGKRYSAAPLESVEPSAEAPIESRRELRELLDDIGHLSDRQRQALVMRELGGLSYEEIGEALECSPAAAKQAAFDARGALHELAEARDTDCESIRRRISDGDRRLLRARGVRAHLRSCDPCRHFEATLQTRKAKLAGLVPVLSPAASAAILQTILGGAGASSAAVAGGAAAVGGGAAAVGGGGAAATGGGIALGGSAAIKGAVAGLAALVATGGAIAVKEQRSGSNDRDGSGSAAQVREATSAPPASGAAAPRTGTVSDPDGAAAGSTGNEAGEANGGANGGGQAGNQASKGNGQFGGSAEGGAEGSPSGSQPAGPRPGGPGAHPPRPGGPHPSQPGGPRPPRPGGTAPGPTGSGGGSGPAPGGNTGPRPAGSTEKPPLDGSTTPLEPRPPRPPRGTETEGTATESPIRPPRIPELQPEA